MLADGDSDDADDDEDFVLLHFISLVSITQNKFKSYIIAPAPQWLNKIPKCLGIRNRARKWKKVSPDSDNMLELFWKANIP